MAISGLSAWWIFCRLNPAERLLREADSNDGYGIDPEPGWCVESDHLSYYAQVPGECWRVVHSVETASPDEIHTLLAALEDWFPQHEFTAVSDSVARRMPSYLRLCMECDSKRWLPNEDFHSRFQELLRHIRKAMPPATSSQEPLTTSNDATLLAIKRDTKHDTGKKSKRILKTVHYDCIRLYKAEIRPEAPRPAMRQIVEDYVAANPSCGSTVASIMRVLNDHPGKWKLKKPTPRRQPR